MSLLQAASIFLALEMTCQVVNLAGRLLVAGAVGAKVKEVALFFGPTIVRVEWRGVEYRLGLIPLGNSVGFLSEEDDPSEAFEALHPLKRLAVIASAEVVLVLLACVCLGPGRGLNSVARGLGQLVRGACAPSTARGLLTAMFALIGRDPVPTGLGVVAAKLAASNLLPVLPLDGGRILLILLGGRKGLPERITVPFICVGMLANLALVAAWTIAVARMVAQAW